MSITIRELRAGDEQAVLDMAIEFIALTPYGRFFPPKLENVSSLLNSTISFGKIFVAEDAQGGLVGCIGGALCEHAMMTGKYIEEVMWFVRPNARNGTTGPALLAALEDWGSSNGAILCKMAAPAASPVGMLLDRSGYEQLETNYVKLFVAPAKSSEPVVIRGVTEDDLQRLVRRQQRQQRRGRGERGPENSDGSTPGDGAGSDAG